MNTISKILIAGLLSFVMLTAAAQPADAVAGATKAACHAQPTEAVEAPHGGCQMMMAPSVDFQSVKVCFDPRMGAFVAVDSVECSIHLVKTIGDSLKTVAVYQTDNTHKRHDLKNILRPVSVGTMGPYVVLLASAVNDSAYIALLDQELNVVARHDFRSPMYAMHIAPGCIFVVGRNPYGYDINEIHFDSPETFGDAAVMTHHYRVAKQAEKIKHSDPVGIGLTATAVAVVFIALVCIALLITGSGKLITRSEEKSKNKGKKAAAIKPVSDGSSTTNEQEVFAAIAAAIHLYNEELHDEEDGVITIQKVEREWTPWNAKFYNMNHYFNNRR